jgi:hypothetical protein
MPGFCRECGEYNTLTGNKPAGLSARYQLPAPVPIAGIRSVSGQREMSMNVINPNSNTKSLQSDGLHIPGIDLTNFDVENMTYNLRRHINSLRMAITGIRLMIEHEGEPPKHYFWAIEFMAGDLEDEIDSMRKKFGYSASVSDDRGAQTE